MNGIKRKEYGDYQTPTDFAFLIINYIYSIFKIRPDLIIEPTCGKGNFLKESLNIFPESNLIGIDINQNYINEAKLTINNDKATFYCSNILDFDLSLLKIKSNFQTIIIGNPPWVTNSKLSKLNCNNLPIKKNFKNLKGIEALTGLSNFDICEYIFLKLINFFKNTDTIIALLCKTTVARNVFIEMHRQGINFNFARIVKFDTKKVFNVSVDACLFILRLSSKNEKLQNYEVYDIVNPSFIKDSVRITNNVLISENCNYNFEGKCNFVWRQGVKHDCVNIMELYKKDGYLFNKLNEKVDIEEDLLFPLIKSSSLKKQIINEYSKYIILTQKYIGEDTNYISLKYPKTWKYLKNNEIYFLKRKSSIYNKSKPFSIFGIGNYSFSKYKVGVSGFYKKPIFSLLSSNMSDKPVIMDDTCYFLSFNTYDEAYIIMLALNHFIVQDFIKNISFIDSKRPYSKKILDRIDFIKVFDYLSYKKLKKCEERNNLLPYLSKDTYSKFKKSLKNS